MNNYLLEKMMVKMRSDCKLWFVILSLLILAGCHGNTSIDNTENLPYNNLVKNRTDKKSIRNSYYDSLLMKVKADYKVVFNLQDSIIAMDCPFDFPLIQEKSQHNKFGKIKLNGADLSVAEDFSNEKNIGLKYFINEKTRICFLQIFPDIESGSFSEGFFDLKGNYILYFHFQGESSMFDKLENIVLLSKNGTPISQIRLDKEKYLNKYLLTSFDIAEKKESLLASDVSISSIKQMTRDSLVEFMLAKNIKPICQESSVIYHSKFGLPIWYYKGKYSFR